MTAPDRAALEQAKEILKDHAPMGFNAAQWCDACSRGKVMEDWVLWPCPVGALLSEHERLSREVERLRQIPELLLSRRCLKNDTNTYDYRTGWHNAMEHAANVVKNQLAAAHADGSACLLREEPKPE
jgi:hypothetical protein